MEWCKNNKKIRQVWSSICKGAVRIRIQQVTHMTVSLEICTDTWKNKDHLRLHCHIVVDFKESMDRGSQFLYLNGIPPSSVQMDWNGMHNEHGFKGKRQRKQKDSGSCHYYGQIAKRGKLWSTTDKEAFKTFHVNPLWVRGLVESDKMSIDDAKHDMAKTCVDVRRNIENLEDVVQYRSQAATAQYIMAIQTRLADLRKPMQEPHEIEEWRAQYDKLEERYRMLVLHGRSKTGKTMWARTAFGPQKYCYEVNCSSGQEPDMRNFDFWFHKFIMLDEAKPEQILRNKKFVQAQPLECVLGTSNTNCHRYLKICHRVPIIICCNDWEPLFLALKTDADREWLTANCVVRKIDNDLY